MTFNEYVEAIDQLIVEYTKNLSKKTLVEIEKTIEGKKRRKKLTNQLTPTN